MPGLVQDSSKIIFGCLPDLERRSDGLNAGGRLAGHPPASASKLAGNNASYVWISTKERAVLAAASRAAPAAACSGVTSLLVFA